MIKYYTNGTIYYVSEDNNYNVALTLTPSTRSFWSFSSCVDSNSAADCFTFHDTNQNADGTLETLDTRLLHDVQPDFQTMGYTCTEYVNPSINVFGSAMTGAGEILMYCGHGTPGAVVFYTTNNLEYGFVVSYRFLLENRGTSIVDTFSIEDCTANALADKNLVVYIGCNTGGDLNLYGATYNLLEATYAKGAHCVIGTTETVFEDDCQRWIELFTKHLKTYDVETAASMATDAAGLVKYRKEDGTIGRMKFPYVIVGDKTQYLY